MTGGDGEILSGPVAAIRARIRVPGDKSIGHRALLLNAIAGGPAEVRGLARGADLAATAGALEALGFRIERTGDRARIAPRAGAVPWRAAAPIDCGNSGTAARLLLGILAARAGGPVTLTGDRSLRGRPMRRVVEPLARMGARIRTGVEASADRAAARAVSGTPDRLPLTVEGRPLAGIRHRLEVASAQVKSALLLAGLAASGETEVEEPARSRDHTERMLAWMGAELVRARSRVTIRGGAIEPRDVDVPGDLSSAAPFLALAAAVPDGEVVVENVGLNPTRTGFLDLLRAFGADVEVEVRAEEPEPRGRLVVRGRGLRGVEVRPDAVAGAIDELPLVAVLAARAEGETVVRGAAELRVKESDRIEAIAAGLRRLGARIETSADGFRVSGPARLEGGALDAAGDHRIGMALAVAAVLARGRSALGDAAWVDVSYPGFFTELARVAVGAPTPLAGRA